METGVVPYGPPEALAGLPDQSTNQVDGWDPRVAKAVAKDIADTFKQQKQNRRQHDLECEKYLVHVVGSGDSQWADIIDGSRVRVPVNIGGGLRYSDNYLAPLLDNYVSYHTAQDFQVVVEPQADPESRDRAMVDMILVNSILKRQRINDVFGEALWLAGSTGFCPVHAQWRTDLTSDIYQPIYDVHLQSYTGPTSGFVDLWCGDPFDTVFNEGAKRRSVQWLSYGRILPTDLLRKIFAHVPGIDGLEGNTSLGSASRTQRVLKHWEADSASMHGTAAIFDGNDGEELSAVICREFAPGIDPNFPEGSLEIVALKGVAETDEDKSGATGEAMLLHQGPLPGQRFSLVNVYSGHAGDDVHGRPYLKDLDEPQIRLNQILTMEIENLRRFARPPLKTMAGSLVDDSIILDDDAILEFADDPQALAATNYLFPPAGAQEMFKSAKEEAKEYMFRRGGWQAASRGEGDSGDSGVKVRFMARADDSIHAQTRRGISESLVSLCELIHALCKENMLVPEKIQAVTGDDFAYLASDYVDQTKLSDEPPQFRVSSEFGATPEDAANELFTLATTATPDGFPLIDREMFWKRYPKGELRPPGVDAKDMKENRTQFINYALKQIVKDLRAKLGPNAGQMLQQVAQTMQQQFPVLPDDDPKMRMEALSLLSQDETEDPMVRMVARQMQAQIAGILQQQMAQKQAAQVQAAQADKGDAPSRGRPQPSSQPPRRGLPSPTNPGAQGEAPENEAIVA